MRKPNGLPMYSDKAKALFYAMVDERRLIFRKEFSHALSNERQYELKDGYRFRDNDRCFNELENNTPENLFMLTPSIAIDKVLMSKAYGDYYYKYEKDWG